MTHFKTLNFLATTIAVSLCFGGCQTAASQPDMTVIQQPGSQSSPLSENKSRLVLNVTGYEAATGQMMVALYTDAAAFDEEAAPLRDAQVTIDGLETQVVFEDLSTGQYAFKLYHDENGNGALDTGAFGIPTENYYFSNDASDPFSAPEFEEAAFTLEAGEAIKTINLN